MSLTVTAADDEPPVTAAGVSGAQRACGPNACYVLSATVTLTTNEPATTYYGINSAGAFQVYTAPLVLTTEGANVVRFYSVDTIGNVETLTKTVTATVTYLSTGVLDNFNRADGGVGTNWSGLTGTRYYRIASQRVDVGNGGAIYWRSGNAPGVNQEAFVTLTTVDPNGSEHGLLLKVQGGANPGWSKGVIEVIYDATANAGAGAVRVETYKPSSGWYVYPSGNVTYQSGDQFGARVLAAGDVWIYRNCAVVARVTLTSADQAFFNTKGGRIGLWFSNAAGAFFDDLGGGTASAMSSIAPQPAVPSTDWKIYMPLVSMDSIPAPDLIVHRVIATTDSAQVVIMNQGIAPVLPGNPFWVDLYVNPSPPPTGVNETWDDGRSSQGIVWGVDDSALPLDPGETLTIFYGGAYYWPSLSRYGPLDPGTPIYVQVDSADLRNMYGSVTEDHELNYGKYNNVSSPVFSADSVEDVLTMQPSLADHFTPALEYWPSR